MNSIKINKMIYHKILNSTMISIKKIEILNIAKDLFIFTLCFQASSKISS